MYEYSALLIKVVDGDTIHADVDLGFDVREKMKFRLAGINAPELPTPEGVAAQQYVEANLPQAFVIRTAKDRQEKYGRYLAWLILPDGRCINRMLVDAGLAVPYPPYLIDPPPAGGV